jgi:hypothetical protein
MDLAFEQFVINWAISWFMPLPDMFSYIYILHSAVISITGTSTHIVKIIHIFVNNLCYYLFLIVFKFEYHLSLQVKIVFISIILLHFTQEMFT